MYALWAFPGPSLIVNDDLLCESGLHKCVSRFNVLNLTEPHQNTVGGRGMQSLLCIVHYCITWWSTGRHTSTHLCAIWSFCHVGICCHSFHNLPTQLPQFILCNSTKRNNHEQVWPSWSSPTEFVHMTANYCLSKKGNSEHSIIFTDS